MADYRLAYEVTDLEGNRLLAAGTQLTRRVMEDLSSRKPGAIKTCRLSFRLWDGARHRRGKRF